MVELTEAEFQKAVIQLAKLHGWRIMHTQPAQIRPGKWITPNTGDQGFPDLVISHPYSGTIFIELKTDRGIVSENQWDWFNSLQDSGMEVYIWRPKDLEKISARLARTTRHDSAS